MRTSVIRGVAAAFVLAVPLAIGASTQEAPKPAPEMAQIAFFEGSWTCEGKMFATPMGPAGEMKSTADIRKDMNGFFQTGTIKGTMANMPPFEGHFYATYDAGMKRFVMLWVDNMGGWAQNTSAGWKGDVMVYEGDGHMGGQTVKGRDTFTKTGTNAMKHATEMQLNGKWTPAGEETCRKK
jgi:uncharacterized protein DUF1579